MIFKYASTNLDAYIQVHPYELTKRIEDDTYTRNGGQSWGLIKTFKCAYMHQ